MRAVISERLSIGQSKTKLFVLRADSPILGRFVAGRKVFAELLVVLDKIGRRRAGIRHQYLKLVRFLT